MENLKPNAQRAKTAITIIWIMLGIELLYIFFQIVHLLVLNDDNLSEGIERIQLKIVIFNFLFSIISIVTFLQWFSRAYQNLNVLNGYLSYEKYWAIWSWFIPILNLFRPYQITKEMFLETEKIIGDTQKSSMTIVSVWWFFFVFTSVLSIIATLLFFRNEDNVLFNSTLELVIDVISIPNFFLTISVIKSYSLLEKQIDSIPVE